MWSRVILAPKVSTVNGPVYLVASPQTNGYAELFNDVVDDYRKNFLQPRNARLNVPLNRVPRHLDAKPQGLRAGLTPIVVFMVLLLVHVECVHTFPVPRPTAKRLLKKDGPRPNVVAICPKLEPPKTFLRPAKFIDI